MIRLPSMPRQIADLPRDERGYPVPWFVTWIDGKPEFRVSQAEKLVTAVKQRRCWVCGQKIVSEPFVFVLGPMCSITRTTAEPPCHYACAEFSAKACPFLTHPRAERREANMPSESALPAGEVISRNPGCCALWTCDAYDLFDDGKGGTLFEVGPPSRVDWFAEGRMATLAEVQESIRTGLPILESFAKQDDSVAELHRRVKLAEIYLPRKVTHDK